MRIHCIDCGKSVSTEVPADTMLRAVAVCPECIDAVSGGSKILAKLKKIDIEKAVKERRGPCDETTKACSHVLKCSAHGGICQVNFRHRKERKEKQ